MDSDAIEDRSSFKIHARIEQISKNEIKKYISFTTELSINYLY